MQIQIHLKEVNLNQSGSQLLEGTASRDVSPGSAHRS